MDYTAIKKAAEAYEQDMTDFLRELVSNAVDATQKLKTLQGAGDFKGSTEQPFEVNEQNRVTIAVAAE